MGSPPAGMPCDPTRIVAIYLKDLGWLEFKAGRLTFTTWPTEGTPPTFNRAALGFRLDHSGNTMFGPWTAVIAIEVEDHVDDEVIS